MFNLKINNQTFDFETGEGVFVPTDTTRLLVASAHKVIKGPEKILDLGCGIGIIGIILSKLGCVNGAIYGSDLSSEAIDLARKNAEKHGAVCNYKTGSLFEPWVGEKFDVILDDVPGISSAIQKHSHWFPSGIPFAPGEDGSELVCQVIERAPQYLNPNGRLIFPVLSLSNTEKILSHANKSFQKVSLIGRRMWGLTDEMKSSMEELRELQRDRKIFLEEKFGMVLWYTEVYEANIN